MALRRLTSPGQTAVLKTTGNTQQGWAEYVTVRDAPWLSFQDATRIRVEPGMYMLTWLTTETTTLQRMNNLAELVRSDVDIAGGAFQEVIVADGTVNELRTVGMHNDLTFMIRRL